MIIWVISWCNHQSQPLELLLTCENFFEKHLLIEFAIWVMHSRLPCRILITAWPLWMSVSFNATPKLLSIFFQRGLSLSPVDDWFLYYSPSEEEGRYSSKTLFVFHKWILPYEMHESIRFVYPSMCCKLHIKWNLNLTIHPYNVNWEDTMLIENPSKHCYDVIWARLCTFFEVKFDDLIIIVFANEHIHKLRLIKYGMIQ